MGVARRGKEIWGGIGDLNSCWYTRWRSEVLGDWRGEGRGGLKKQELGNSCWHAGIDMMEWQAGTGSMWWRFQNLNIGRV